MAERPIIRIATEVDIPHMARLQWFTRKLAVSRGMTPQQELHINTTQRVSDREGIAWARKDLEISYNPRITLADMEGNQITSCLYLVALLREKLIGKAGVFFIPSIRTAEFHSLEVEVSSQGKGIARALREESVAVVQQQMPSVEFVRFRRYVQTQKWGEHRYPRGLFSRLREAAMITPGVQAGDAFETFVLPIEEYRRLLTTR